MRCDFDNFAVTATCDQEIRNNVTYIVSPNFPALMPTTMKSCKLKIKMMSPDVSQLRFDFVHFSMVRINLLKLHKKWLKIPSFFVS